MPFLIRDITADDYAGIAALWQTELQCPAVTAKSLAVTMEKMRRDPAYATFVAVADEEIVGFATVVRVLAAEHPSGYMKMNGIAVRRDHQRAGVGKALMARVEAFARERGASQIGLASGLQRAGAHAFYERLGYKKGSYYFSKSL